MLCEILEKPIYSDSLIEAQWHFNVMNILYMSQGWRPFYFVILERSIEHDMFCQLISNSKYFFVILSSIPCIIRRDIILCTPMCSNNLFFYTRVITHICMFILIMFYLISLLYYCYIYVHCISFFLHLFWLWLVNVRRRSGSHFKPSSLNLCQSKINYCQLLAL